MNKECQNEQIDHLELETSSNFRPNRPKRITKKSNIKLGVINKNRKPYIK